jgi:DNA polymerase
LAPDSFGDSMTKLWVDSETFSEIPIQCGVHRYAEAAELLMLQYAIDDGPITVLDIANGDSFTPELREAMDDPTVELWAHNSHFDRTILRYTIGFDTDISRWHDTMIQAYSHSLPGALGMLCEVLKVPTDQAKDKDGKALIQLFCKPQPQNRKIRRATKFTHPEQWARFLSYGGLDITAMRACYNRMPKWNITEFDWKLWGIDQRINDRGFLVDEDLVEAAISAIEREKGRLAGKAKDMTDGEVESATQRDAVLRYALAAYGVDLPDLKASTLERRINDDSLPVALRELLALRLQASSTSVSKYKVLKKAASEDQRLRGTMQFRGALRTGRWAGRMFQPQNLPRPTLKDKDIQYGIDLLKSGIADLAFPNVTQLVSSSVRSAIIAPPGKKLVVADLSNIEGRMLAWLAGEQWKLQAFTDYDTILGTDEKGHEIRKGHDLYILSYANSFRVSPELVIENKNAGGNWRQIGKVQELALGYEGGVGAFLTFAATYQIDLEDMAKNAWDTLPTDLMSEAKDSLAWTLKNKRSTFGLSNEAWLTCEVFKRGWRYAHPEISSWWRELDFKVRQAIANPGMTYHSRRVAIRKDGAWLRIRLPSGRFLCYPQAAIEDNKITYTGINQYSRKWCRLQTYGGKLAENITQAAACDIIAWSMPRIEDAGYAILMSVHDEFITETADNTDFSSDSLAALMSQGEAWSQGLPLAAAGFESYYYKKD